MKIINREMGGGKTYALVEMMLEPGNEDVIFVAPTYSQAQSIAYPYAAQIVGESSKALRDRFISVAHLLSDRKKYEGRRFVIDEVNGVLGVLTGGHVLAVAGTDEDLEAGQRQRIAERSYQRRVTDAYAA